MKTRERVLWLSAPILLIAGAGEAAAQQYCDPQVDSACYARWCEAQGGTVYNNASGYGCDTSGGSSSGGGYTPGYSSDPTLMLFQNVLQSVGQSFIQGMQQAQQRAQQQAIAKQRQQLQEQAARARALQEQQAEQAREVAEIEARHRQAFEEAKQRMLGEMRGGDAGGDLQSRDLSGSRPALQVESRPGAFGTQELQPRPIGAPATVATAGPPLPPLAQASCGAALMRSANQAAAAGDVARAAYLSGQASDVLNGSASAGTRPCDLPDVPDVEGVPLSGKLPSPETQRKQALVLDRLYHRANQEMADYRSALQAAQRAEQNHKAAEAQVQQAQAQVQVLQGSAAPNAPGQPAAADANQQSAMAEAQAALRQAQAALTDSEQAEQKSLAAQAQLRDRLQQTKGMLQSAQDPKQLDSLFDELGGAQQGGKS